MEFSIQFPDLICQAAARSVNEPEAYKPGNGSVVMDFNLSTKNGVSETLVCVASVVVIEPEDSLHSLSG